MNPIGSHACKHSGFLGSKEIKMQVNIPKSGYVPGEMIPISLLLHNHSKKPVFCVKAQLIQHVHYQAQQENTHLFPDEHCHKHCDHKTAETIIFEMDQDFHVRCCSKEEIRLTLVLPNPLVPTFKTGIIEVDYCIMVMLDKEKKLRCELPVTIGTVPIGRQAIVMSMPSFVEPNAPIENVPPQYTEYELASAPPPEYDEHL
uniref:Arrestin_C domain-containing protein n=1 Tax=Caenorhabditis tropicalis TaxID=1561998 RepID=A0A1I7T7U6_9PELO